jgi:hypothetical protein
MLSDFSPANLFSVYWDASETAATVLFQSPRSKHKIVNDILQTVLSGNQYASSHYKYRTAYLVWK